MALNGGWKVGVTAAALLVAAGGVFLVAGGGDGTAARGAGESAIAERMTLATSSEQPAYTSDATMQIWKTPACQCCAAWVDHVREAGFQVDVNDVTERELIALKHRHGITAHLSSCHTALVDGYAVEGHVPAEDVHRLLVERPDVQGIAVPGMPVGSPGMEIGNRKDPYDVVTFRADGSTRVFSSYR